MALVITPIAATPHMLRLEAVNAGEGNATATITQTALIAACAAGPLKSLFTNPFAEAGPPGPGVAAWTSLFLDKRLSISQYPLGAVPNTAALDWVLTPNALSITSAGTVIIELRYDHTLVR